MARYTNPTIQYLDGAGNPVVKGKVYFYDSGTTNFRNTYADSGLNIPNPNPVLLDGAGRVPNVWMSGNYRVVLTTEDDQQVWERDPVQGELATGEFAPWDILTTYSIRSIVRGSDDNYYISLAGNNLGNDPTTTPTSWSQVAFVVQWNPNQNYKINDNVFESGVQYRALTDNVNKQPSTNPSDWGVPTGGIVAGNPVSVLTNDVPYLAAGNNLSDVSDSDTARGNLDAVGLSGDETIAGQKTFSDQTTVGTLGVTTLNLTNVNSFATSLPFAGAAQKGVIKIEEVSPGVFNIITV